MAPDTQHSQTIRDAFERGEYARVAAEHFDSGLLPESDIDRAYVIGSLSFLGRLEEADALYDRHQPEADSLSVLETMAARRFFLAIAHLRHGSRKTALGHLLANLRMIRKRRVSTTAHFTATRSLATFYVTQGMAFARYRSGRLEAAMRWARVAQAEAVRAGSLYARVLVGDLMGHVRVNLGEVRLGIRELERTRALAQTLGSGGVVQALDASICIYRARHGVHDSAAATDHDLKLAIERCGNADSYTLASLLLERARTTRMMGQSHEERVCLARAADLVHAVPSAHLRATFALRQAVRLTSIGQSDEALEILKECLSNPTIHNDLTLKSQLLGVRWAIERHLGQAASASSSFKVLCELATRTGAKVSSRILARHDGLHGPTSRLGDDPLGDLMDDLARRGRASCESIVASGWLGLLYGALALPLDVRALVFDVEVGSLSLFDRGDVVHFGEGVSPMARQFLLELAHQPRTKEALVQSIWGHSYHPLKHDSLVYALVTKVRRQLGERGQWIQADGEGYALLRGVRILNALESLAPENSSGDRLLTNGVVLNARQAALIKWAQEGTVLDVRSAVESLGSSEATVSRDFARLVEIGLLQRIGKGRSTRYVAEQQMN